MKIYAFIIVFLLFQKANAQIEKIKILLHDSEENVAVPEKYKAYCTKEQIKEFEHGADVLTKDICRIYFITYYTLDTNKIIAINEGYYYTDAPVGPQKIYYASGKLSKEKNYALVNSHTKKIISMEEFNKFRNLTRKGSRGYEGMPHGKWKYYSEGGTLIKEEEYDRGALIKTTNY